MNATTNRQLDASVSNGLVQWQSKRPSRNYAMKQKIGSGQFSVVYCGEDSATRQQLAIKAIDMIALEKHPVFCSLLENEIQVLHLISHPNVIKLIEVFGAQNQIYIVTELCNQGSISNITLQQATLLISYKIKGEFPSRRQYKYQIIFYEAFWSYKIKVASNNLNLTGVIHRDIKPANILFSDGIPKLGDFGFAISKLVQQKNNEVYEFNVGTPLYMPPETLFNNIYSLKTDIWSLGVVAYEMIYGMQPFHSETEQELAKKITWYGKINQLQFPQFGQQISQKMKILLQGMLEYETNNRWGLDQILNYLDSFNNNILQPRIQQRQISNPAFGQVLPRYTQTEKKSSRSDLELKFICKENNKQIQQSFEFKKKIDNEEKLIDNLQAKLFEEQQLQQKIKQELNEKLLMSHRIRQNLIFRKEEEKKFISTPRQFLQNAIQSIEPIPFTLHQQQIVGEKEVGIPNQKIQNNSFQIEQSFKIQADQKKIQIEQQNQLPKESLKYKIQQQEKQFQLELEKQYECQLNEIQKQQMQQEAQQFVKIRFEQNHQKNETVQTRNLENQNLTKENFNVSTEQSPRKKMREDIGNQIIKVNYY